MAKLPDSLEPAGNTRPKRASVLLVDDIPANLVTLRAILDDAAYDLVEARSGEEALDRLKAQEFAVVLLDVQMPGMSGFDTAKQIRADQRSQHTPIIFLTADDTDRDQVEAGYALHAVDFLVKPLSPVVIQAKVRGIVKLFQRQEQARQEAEQLRLIVEGTTDYAIFMLDPEGRVATWNAGAERLKGYRPDEIIGQHFSRFYPQDVIDRGWPEHELTVAVAEGRFEDEGWRLRKDGSRFWANVLITALRDETGQLRGFSKVTRDLTERMRAEEALRRSEERFRHMVEGVQDYAIFMLDQSGNVATWNAGAERIKQYESGEIIGQHFSKFYPQEAIDRGWPDHELKVAAAEGRFEDEGWRVRKDGSQFWANVVITAVKDDQGGLLGFTKVTRDLTARKQAEENARRLAEETAARQAAHEERERLRVTLASIGDGVISTDAEGRVDFLNPVAQELVGWESDEAAGMTLENVFRIVNEATRQPVENPALRALKEGRVVGLANHTVLISKDGMERPIDDSAAPIRDTGGNVIGSVLVFRDVSERKRNEATLAERMRLLALNAAIGESLVQAEALGTMLHRCADALVKHLDGAFARIWTLNEAESVLELRASAGMYTHLDGPHSRVPVGQYKIGQIARDRQPHLTNAVVSDPRVSDQEWAEREGMVAFAGYPLVVDDRLVGVMALFARQSLSDATLEAMASVADEIAIGIERKFSQDRLNEQREWLAVTLASIGDAVITTDTQGQATFLNGVAQDLTGWTRGEAHGRPLDEVFVILNEQTRQPVENPVKKVLRDGSVVGLANHTILVARDGTERPIDDSAAPIRDSSGKTIGVVLIFRDVTVQRRTDRAIREREQELQLVTGHAPVFLVHFDQHARYRYVNKRFADWLGLTPEDMLGKHIADVIGRPAYSTLRGQIEAALAGKHVEFEAEIPYQQIGPHFMRCAYAPEYDESGRVAGLVAVIADVTERKRAEEALRHSEQRFARFMQHLPGLAWIKDTSGRYVYANEAAERTFRRPRADLYGKTDDEIFPPEVAARFSHNDRQAVASGSGVQVVETLEHEDGTLHYSLVTKFPIQGPGGDVAFVGGMAIDITDQRRAEEDVRHSEERFRSLMEQAPFSIQVFSPDGRTIRVNRAWEELWGVRSEQIGGYNILEDHQLEAKGILHFIQQGFAGQSARIPPIEYDPNETIPDITEHADPGRWLSAVIYPIKDADGRVREVVLIHEDITARHRAEAELRDARSRLDAALEAGAIVTWTWDIPNNRLYSDDNLARLFNLPPSESDGGALDKYIPSIHPDDWPKVSAALNRSVESDGDYEADYRIIQTDGSVRWVVARGRVQRDERGRPLRMPGVLVDITERKRLDEELRVRVEQLAEADRRKEELLASLRESEQRFRHLADAMPQIVWTARPNGQIDYLNHRWTEFTGLPETVGNEGWGSLLHPDEAQAAAERWAASVQSGAPFDMELRLLERGKNSYRWHLIRTVAVEDEAGAVIRWFGTATDIHEQKRAEESARYLAEASAALASVVDYESTLQKVATLAVPHFADWSTVDVANGDGTLRRLAVAHRDAEKVALVHRLMQEYPPDPESPTGAFAVLRTGKPQMIGEIADEMLAKAAKDERHLTLIRSLGLKSYICVPLVASGNPLGVLTFATAESGRTYTEADLALATDLAQRAGVAVENTRLYQALREADRRKDEFLATLAHELRNPLAPIRNSLQILSMPRVDVETAQRSREMMERQVHHLVRLVDDLLDVSRVMRGKIELRRERVELAAVVARAVETVQPLVETQGHQLSVSLPTESLAAEVDPVRLAQVVGNLLTNAAKYTEPNGHIWLTVERDGNVAVLRVRDSGIGIAKDMLPRIFELFVQVDHASTKAQGGLGIGLTLVKNLVDMHGGTVEARSEGLGQGSEFVVRLPILGNHIPEDRIESGQSPDPVLASGYRLLVVDDNQDAAVSLAMLLKLQGHEVRVAHSGLAALEMTKTFSPDLIFLDIGMPGMDGYEVARRIRQQPGLQHVVLAALTGWGQQEDRRRTAESGFDHHLVKPPEPKALETLLADLKQRRG